jgi:hypothetical protein
MRTTEQEPTFREVVHDTVDLVDVVAVAGPPVIFLAGPWAFLTLMLAAPVAVAVTLVMLFAAVAALVGLVGAVFVAPFLLVRHVRERRGAHRPTPAPAARQVVTVGRGSPNETAALGAGARL